MVLNLCQYEFFLKKGSPHRELWKTAAVAHHMGTMRTITKGMKGSMTFLDWEHSLGQGHSLCNFHSSVMLISLMVLSNDRDLFQRTYNRAPPMPLYEWAHKKSHLRSKNEALTFLRSCKHHNIVKFLKGVQKCTNHPVCGLYTAPIRACMGMMGRNMCASMSLNRPKLTPFRRSQSKDIFL